MKLRIAFLGVGIMGSGMIKNLQRNGYALNIYNRTIEKARKIAKKDDLICNSPAQAAKTADIIFSSVSNDQASKDVWFGKNGAVKTARKNAIVIETSTLSIPYIDEWTNKMKKYGFIPIDCPVTGSKLGAENATLSLFLGGRLLDIHKILPVFKTISQQTFYFGVNGNGMRFKLIYNMLGAVILCGLAEAIGLAQAFGLNIDFVVETLANNKQGWSMAAAKSKGINMVKKSHSQVFCSLDVFTKDISYAVKSARYFNKNLPTSIAAKKVMEMARRNDRGKLDMSVVGDLFID